MRGDKFEPGDWAIDIMNDHEVMVLRRLPDHHGTYEVMRPIAMDGSLRVSYRQGVQFLRKKSEFKVGDKVRPIAGEVIDTDSNHNHIRVKWDDGYGWFESKLLELVERPKKEPKLGSVWRFKRGSSPYQKGQYVYIGSGRYYKANEPGIYTDMDLANSSELEEVTNNDNA